MKRRLFRSVLVLCLVGVVASPALADLTGTFSRGYGTGDGGEFIFTSSGDFDGQTFDPFVTFCLERNEYLNFSATFTVVGIDTAAYGGGVGGGSPDPLDPRTAFLYQNFREGSLIGYAIDGAARDASADALQRVVWGIEGELGAQWTPDAGLETTFFNAANAAVVNANWSGLGNVRVMNIEWPDGTPAQSQLMLVPAPGALLLGLMGLGLVGGYRRWRHPTDT